MRTVTDALAPRRARPGCRLERVEGTGRPVRGLRAMAGSTVGRDGRRAGPRPHGPRGRTFRLLGGAALGCAAAPGASQAASQVAADVLPALTRLEPHGAVGFALTMGFVIFSTTLALLHMRERSRWSERERKLVEELAALRGARDRADMLLGAEAQVVIGWDGRDAAPRLEGDVSIAGAAAPRRVLAFGSWLAPADVPALEAGIERLKERGEGFRLVLKKTGEGYVEAEGRTVSGRALLRLRDVTGDRLDLLWARRTLDEANASLHALQALLDAIPQPVWRRDAAGRLAWANQGYLTA